VLGGAAPDPLGFGNQPAGGPDFDGVPPAMGFEAAGLSPAPGFGAPAAAAAPAPAATPRRRALFREALSEAQIQTGKAKPIPLLLFDEAYWRRIVNFEAMVEEGVISEDDLDLFRYVESADQAWSKISEYHGLESRTGNGADGKGKGANGAAAKGATE